jgi:transposase
VRGWAAHATRHLIGARAQLVGMATDLSNQIRSLPRTFGLRGTGRAGGAFEARVRARIEDRPEVAAVAEPLLAAWRAVRGQITVLDRKLIEATKGDAACRPPMTCPGVGAVVAAGFAAALEAPGHFRRSRSVGACLGLTPRRHPSGETDHSAGVSKRGDKLLRSHLFEAAASLLIRVQRPSALKAWGVGLVQRLGFKRATVAGARKLGVALHAIGRESRPFQAWPSAAAAA